MLHTHLSDRTGQKITFNIPLHVKSKQYVTKRIFNNENIHKFILLLKAENWDRIFYISEEDVNKQWDTLMTLLLNAFNTSLSLKNIILKNNSLLIAKLLTYTILKTISVINL